MKISALGEDTFKRIVGDCEKHKLDRLILSQLNIDQYGMVLKPFVASYEGLNRQKNHLMQRDLLNLMELGIFCYFLFLLC